MHEYPPQVEDAFKQLNKKREESRKRFERETAEREVLLASAKADYEKELRQTGATVRNFRNGSWHDDAEPKMNSPEAYLATARYNARVEEIVGIRTAKDRLDQQHGPAGVSLSYTPSGHTPGGIGSQVGAIHAAVRGIVAGKEAEREKPVFTFSPERAMQRKATATMEYKSFSSYSTKAAGAAGSGLVEAIVSVVGNEDLGGDIVQKGAFTRFIADVKSGACRYPTLMYGHQVENGLAAIVGKVVDMTELDSSSMSLPADLKSAGYGALKILAQFNMKTQSGRDCYEHVVAGDLNDWSYAYSSESEMDSKGRRLLKEIYPVYEVSAVLTGMNPLTRTTAVKSADSSGIDVNRVREYIRQQLRKL
jgi:HK97 family phage prohead protease